LHNRCIDITATLRLLEPASGKGLRGLEEYDFRPLSQIGVDRYFFAFFSAPFEDPEFSSAARRAIACESTNLMKDEL
jgi:hypothetical protein